MSVVLFNQLGNIGPPASVPNGSVVLQDDQRQDEPLPPGWEMRLDTYGRRYYVDHNTRYGITFYLLEFVKDKNHF